MSATSEELLFGPDTTSTRPRAGLDSHDPKSQSDTDRLGHDWGTFLPEINASDTFTVHWAQLPPTPTTTTKRPFWEVSETSQLFRLSTPKAAPEDPDLSTTRQGTIRTAEHQAKATTDTSRTVSPSKGTAIPLGTSQATSAESENTAAAPTLSTHTTSTSTSIGGSQSAHDGALTSGETAAIVVSSFLAFSLCGILGWFRWRHVKKHRAKTEADLDFSSLEPYQEGGLPMADTRAPFATRPRTPSPTLANIDCGQGYWGFNCEVSARSYTRPNMRGDGFRAGDPTIVELPGDYPQEYLNPDSRAADTNHSDANGEGQAHR